jgi:hypothetical protein
MPPVNLDFPEIKKLMKDKEIKKQKAIYEECKWLTGC